MGNVVGSNIFNILAVLGVAAMTSSTGGVNIASSALWMDIPIAVMVAIACMPIFFTGNIINRWEGGIFVGYYVLYTVHLILKASGHEALGIYNTAIGFVVLPLTICAFGFNVWKEFQQGRIKLGK